MPQKIPHSGQMPLKSEKNLVVLVLYRDGRVLVIAAGAFAIDHFACGYLWESSTHGISQIGNALAGPWQSIDARCDDYMTKPTAELELIKLAERNGKPVIMPIINSGPPSPIDSPSLIDGTSRSLDQMLAFG